VNVKLRIRKRVKIKIMMNFDAPQQSEIKLFTIGFAKKNARQFFNILKNEGIVRVVDIRLSNASQFAGYTKKDDLEYFLNEIAHIKYDYRPEMAPTKELLFSYKKKKINWKEYVEKFSMIMVERKIENIFKQSELNNICLLCSEPSAEYCHRRLVAEYLQAKLGHIEIRNL